MAKEYPYRGLSDFDFWHLHLEQSANMIQNRGEKFVVGFSFVQNGVTKNFVTPELSNQGDFNAYYKGLYNWLDRERSSHPGSPGAQLDHVGWFIDEARNLQNLDPNHTTLLK